MSRPSAKTDAGSPVARNITEKLLIAYRGAKMALDVWQRGEWEVIP